MIYLLKKPAFSNQMQEMLHEYDGMVKIVVDIRQQVEKISRTLLGGPHGQ